MTMTTGSDREDNQQTLETREDNLSQSDMLVDPKPKE